jgi:hypothetical protein
MKLTSNRYITVSEIPPFDTVTAEEYSVLINGWLNHINAEEIGKQLSVSPCFVRTFYSLKNLDYFQIEGVWPDDLREIFNSRLRNARNDDSTK